MSDYTKSFPNPHYLSVPYEKVQWTLESGLVVLREVAHDDKFIYAEGFDERGVIRREQIAKSLVRLRAVGGNESWIEILERHKQREQ